MLLRVAEGRSKGCHALGIRGVAAGFCTGMPVRGSHRQISGGCAPLSPRHLFSSICVHPGLPAHGGIQREGSEGISTL